MEAISQDSICHRGILQQAANLIDLGLCQFCVPMLRSCRSVGTSFLQTVFHVIRMCS